MFTVLTGTADGNTLACARTCERHTITVLWFVFGRPLPCRFVVNWSCTGRPNEVAWISVEEPLALIDAGSPLTFLGVDIPLISLMFVYHLFFSAIVALVWCRDTTVHLSSWTLENDFLSLFFSRFLPLFLSHQLTFFCNYCLSMPFPPTSSCKLGFLPTINAYCCQSISWEGYSLRWQKQWCTVRNTTPHSLNVHVYKLKLNVT